MGLPFRKSTFFFLSLTLFFSINYLLIAETPKICLVMIVKNESKIIERCLNSTKDVVDFVSISDTGSSDNTVEIVETFLKQNQIPGKVHHEQWKNFGYNRTLAAQSAQNMLQEMAAQLQNTYLLFLDADMILLKDALFDKKQLFADSYMLKQQSDSISYYNVRLVRASLPWKSIGVTHEYWSCDRLITQTKLASLVIDDREDGGCKADKFERDLKLLLDGLQDEPDNERYMFYCAQTCKCLKLYEEARRWYQARINKGGWNEEVWYSHMMIAESYEETNMWDDALKWYLQAYEYLPSRAESLERIAAHYRQEGKNELAYMYAKHATSIPYPEDHTLFVSHPVYDYKIDEHIAICAFYTKFKNNGFDAINKLLLKNNVPHHVKEQAKRNSLFYIQSLPNTTIWPIEIALPTVREGSSDTYSPLNPSIKKTDQGYDVICRTVNYTQEGGRNYRCKDLDDIYRTKNFYLKYDKNFRLLSQKEIVENLPRKRANSRVVGLEDCRFVSNAPQPLIFSTVCDHIEGQIVQGLSLLSADTDDPIRNVIKLQPLQGPNIQRCEKNWLPFWKDNQLYAIYGYNPFTIYKIDPVTGNCVIALQPEKTLDISEFRGSAPPIAFDNGYLFLVHEVTFDNYRYYTHRFVFLDKDLKIQKISKPFNFMHKGIEYCCGMCVDHTNRKLLLTIGIEDREAHFLAIDRSAVEALLEPICNIFGKSSL